MLNSWVKHWEHQLFLQLQVCYCIPSWGSQTLCGLALRQRNTEQKPEAEP